jgi:3-methyladenine DNA glycosylase/8-oxoguanine DNA glycosylase
MRVRLKTPRDFSFRRTVNSHGWCDLAPFTAAADATSVATVIAVPGGGARKVVLHDDDGVVLESPGAADVATRRALIAAGRRILALDVDISEFHDVVRGDPRYRWIADTRSGRLLRAPTAWEDVVKLVLTTNCSWAFTKKMTAVLVERYGEKSPDGGRSFPTAARLARVRDREFRDVVRAGYRSPYLEALSRVVSKGGADPEGWDTDRREVAVLRKEILDLPGVGPYVVENLLKFLGRPDGLALDSAIRAQYSVMYHGGRKIKDGTIARRVAPLGRWAGLALWFDLWRGWVGEEEGAGLASSGGKAPV